MVALGAKDKGGCAGQAEPGVDFPPAGSDSSPMAGIPFPNISPEIFQIDLGFFVFSLRWYALAYILGILIAWRLLIGLARRADLWGGKAPFDARQGDEFLTWGILGIILGGRLGYVLFYRPDYYLANPIEIPMLWQGGMSFHGGFLGVVLATVLYARKEGIRLSAFADAVALAAPQGLFWGRIANFINAELWGRPSELPWAVIFPGEAAQDCPGVIGLCARHPSQLYEAGLEGLVLTAVLASVVLLWRGLARSWLVTGLFLIGYGLSRFIVEFFRVADAQYITPDNPLGHVLHFGGWGLSMGQLLSLPMILIGLATVIATLRRPAYRG